MNTFERNSITLMQYIFLIHGAQVATALFSLPRLLADAGGTDGWMSLVINWAVTGLAGWLFLLTLRRYPNLTLPDLAVHLFGKWMGKLVLLLPICYFAFIGWFIIVHTILLIKESFLPQTPEYVIAILLAIPGYMVARYGPRVQGRYSEMMFYMTIWMILFLLIPLRSGHWIHLLPLFKSGWEPIMNGSMSTLSSYIGVEIVFYIYPLLQKKQYAVQGMLIANTLTLFVYLFVTILCFAFFSPEGITNLNQPLLFLLKNLEFRFLERLDIIALALYVIIVSRTWMPYVYCSVFSTSRLLNQQHHRSHTLLYFIAVVASVYFFQPTWNQSDVYRKLINQASIVALLIIPAAMYVCVRSMETFRKWRTG